MEEEEEKSEGTIRKLNGSPWHLIITVVSTIMSGGLLIVVLNLAVDIGDYRRQVADLHEQVVNLNSSTSRLPIIDERQQQVLRSLTQFELQHAQIDEKLNENAAKLDQLLREQRKER